MFGVSTPRLFLLKVNNSNDPNPITAGVEGLAASMPQGFPAFRLSSRSRATDFPRSLRVEGHPRDRRGGRASSHCLSRIPIEIFLGRLNHSHGEGDTPVCAQCIQ